MVLVVKLQYGSWSSFIETEPLDIRLFAHKRTIYTVAMPQLDGSERAELVACYENYY